MGICGGKIDDETVKNRAIDKELNDAERTAKSKIKLLLLGAGESGKSTLFKQMRLLYSETKQFTPNEKESFVAIVYGNIVADVKVLIQNCERHTPIKSSAGKRAADAIAKWDKNQTIAPEEAALLKSVWLDAGVQQTWEDRGDIQVQDAFEYFMTNIDRIGAPNYTPTNDDILRTRVRTSGVVQENFTLDSANFEMYDVGGQRNERRKWIHSFDGVTSLIFVAAISEYNQVLYEDSNVNRQDEAVLLFKQQLDLEYFMDTPVILFLNKVDLFREKLPKISFRVDDGPFKRNSDFAGPHCVIGKDYELNGKDAEYEECYDAACAYLKQLYEAQAPSERTQGIYTYFTNSCDTENIQRIMGACKDIILKENLRRGGWFTD